MDVAVAEVIDYFSCLFILQHFIVILAHCVISLRCAGMSPIGRIVLQKSFCTGDQKLRGPQTQLSCKDVRDLIVQ